MISAAIRDIFFVNTQRLEKIFAWAAAFIAFAVYLATMARTVTWLHNGADSGDLVTAAFTLGIPHPPGYPLYTLVAALFAQLPIGEPAFGVALFSALAAAGAVFALARAGHALLQTFAVSKTSNLFWEWIPPFAALGFAFAPLLWSQATIPEVYALNLFFVAVMLWAVLSTHRHRVSIAALMFGLGAAHHLSILFLVPGAWILLEPKKRDVRAFVWFFVPLLLYAYLPLAALANPPVNWGDPVTPARFFWLVSAEPYRAYWFDVGGAEIAGRTAFAARALTEQFTFVGVAFVLWGAIQMAMARRRVFAGLAMMFVPTLLYAMVYASRDSFLYLLPAFAIALLWLMYGAADVLQMAGDRRLLRVVVIVAVALLPIYNLVRHYAGMDVSRDRAAYEFARANLEELPADAVVFADGDEALFALWYYRHAIAYENARSVIVSQGLLQYDWYYDHLRRTMSEAEFQASAQIPMVTQRVEEIVRVTFAEGRAVCFTASSPLPPNFEYETRGAVQCVAAEKR